MIVYVLAAALGSGFIHPDEYFQILEFANARLGHSPLAELPWEFAERIRPCLQPTLAMGTIAAARILGLLDPFLITAILRTLTACLAWLVYLRAFRVLESRFRRSDAAAFFAFLLMFLWFMPFLSARFSSENLAGIVMLGSILLVAGKDRPWPSASISCHLLAGCLLGISFFLRFQIAFAGLGLGLWLLIIRRPGIARLGAMLAGFLVVCIACAVLDSWFYGELTLSPYRYFDANLVRNRAADFGVAPWYWYIPIVALWTFPLFGIPLLTSALWGAIQRPTDVFVWCLLLFILGHSAIAHKELRFMFPMAFAFVYLAAQGWDNLAIQVAPAKLRRVFLIAFAVTDLALLAGRLAYPLNQQTQMLRAVWSLAEAAPIDVVTIARPLYAWDGLPINFYRHPNVTNTIIPDEEALAAVVTETSGDTHYAVVSAWGPTPSWPTKSVTISYSRVPEWIEAAVPAYVRSKWAAERLIKISPQQPPGSSAPPAKKK